MRRIDTSDTTNASDAAATPSSEPLVVNELHARWLGRVAYREAEQLQRALHAAPLQDYLLLLEHPHVYTMGSSTKPEHVLVDPATVGAELLAADRGGDVTYHGPGQIVGYPIITLAEWRAGQRDVVAYVRGLEAVLIDVLAEFGIVAARHPGYPGVWIDDAKIAAIGVRVARGRTRHGFALNVDPDLSMFGHIVPCGIADKAVTSMADVLGAAPDLQQVVDALVRRFASTFGYDRVERQDVVWHARDTDLSEFSRHGAATDRGAPVRLLGRLAAAGGDVAPDTAARPTWMKVRASLGDGYLDTKRLVRRLDLHTVCEEAGCPNIYECWADRTATFMILGDRCTRACGFCLVDTRRPRPVDPNEPARVASAVAEMELAHVVITCVARDDLDDGGAAVFAATVDAIRTTSPATTVELLISDCRGDRAALDTIFAAAPDVLNHNLETVARLQRAARPSAGYARSLAVLASAKDAGLTTKSGLIAGLGESADELHAAVIDLRAVGVDLLTIGQYLQPTARHLPVARWWSPEEFAAMGEFARTLGFVHVESGPLVRSSYHARHGAEIATRQPLASFT
jgi:lipoic acid synthetase